MMLRSLHHVLVIAALGQVGCSAGTEQTGNQPPQAEAGGPLGQVTMALGRAGGELTLGSAALAVPKGALVEQTEIRIERYAKDRIPENYVGASSLYRFHPGGLAFDSPATVRIPVSSDRAGLRLYWSNEEGGFDIVAGAKLVDGVMVGQVEHFSEGFVGAPTQSDSAGSGGDPDGADGGDGTPPPVASDGPADKLDLLFVVDNSGSMKEEQAALAAAAPRLLAALMSGDLDGDGQPELVPFDDIHAGVITTDMGMGGVEGIDRCTGLGDDGVLRNAAAECGDGGAFLAYEGDVDHDQAAADLACLLRQGTDGCGFEQQLEAVLKAATPSDGEVSFLAATPADQVGQADRGNAGFFRHDAADPSMLAIVLLTDEEDCSTTDATIWTPPSLLASDDPLRGQDLNLRCHENAGSLHAVGRYVTGLRALRPDHPELVFLAVIAGVPSDLVDADALADFDYEDDAARDAFYNTLLGDPRMQEIKVDDTPPGQGSLTPSCQTTHGLAYPPRRITRVAQGLGEYGFVQSICQQDLVPALDRIAARLTAGR